MMNKQFSDVLDRIAALRGAHDHRDRARIRAVMNGGAAGIQAVLKWDNPAQGPGSGKGADTNLGVDLPTANIMASGLERLAQKVGRQPTLKTDMIPTKDTDKARKKAEKRARIVRAWDDTDRMELQYPQLGRWVPGYGFAIHLIRERQFGPGVSYPVAELRDPFDVYPGQWGANQQPQEVAIVRHMSYKLLKQAYPEYSEVFANYERRGQSAGVPIIGQSSGWEGNAHRPIEVIEYLCDDGTYVVVPEIERVVSRIPNPLESGPAFVMTKRFSFDKLQSQFHHVFGLMAMMAKLNILGLIGAEEGTLREVNIIGELVGNTYEKGRGAVNLFEPGSRVEKIPVDQLQQVWQAVNILERQFRTVAGYPVAQDGQSPNSFATGEGIRELGSSVTENVMEYHTAIKHSMEIVDMKRLEWEEKLHAREKKRVYWFQGGASFEEKYQPSKDIAGDYRTKRIYGAMATFDENSKIVAGLQLLQARVFDRRTVQENLDGDINPSLINERLDQDMAKDMMIQGLGERMAQQDPNAAKALVRIYNAPKEAGTILAELLDPEEEDPNAAMAQQMAMAGGGGAPPGMEAGPPPAVQTILSQMETEGGGVMSVGQM